MKNLELKTKKMSLANIEGKLTPAEMENIMAGSCDPQYQLAFATLCGSMLGAVGAFACWVAVYAQQQRNGGNCI